MQYFNYHAKAKKLIADGHLLYAEYYKRWNSIDDALVLFFNNAKPMPIRRQRSEEYLSLIGDKLKIRD